MPRPASKSRPGRFDRLLDSLDGPPGRRLLIGLFAFVALSAAAWGMNRMERWVATLPQACPPVRIEWADLPDWLCLPDNRHILDDLMHCTGVTEDDRLIEPGLAEAVATKLSEPSSAWVRRVVRVVKRPPDTLVIRCEFRRPVAWVRHAEREYLVDAEGVRLPGRYRRDVLSASGLPQVAGVQSPPPPIGNVWQGAEVQAGLSVLHRVRTQPYSHQITGVSVENYIGRRQRERSHIDLLTNLAGARVVWGRAPGEEQAAETSADQKLALMQSIYEHTGRIDMNQSRVDITTWPDRIVTTSGRSGDVEDAGRS